MIAHEPVGDRNLGRTSAESQRSSIPIMWPTPSIPSLVIAWRVENPMGQINRARPIAVLERARTVQTGQAIYDKVAIDEIKMISLIFKILDKGIMIRQFPKL